MITYKAHISQGTIAYWDTNPLSDPSLPTLIFLHGHVTNKKVFSSQVQSTLFDSFRLICIDLPGHGESTPPFNPEKTYSFPGYAEAVAEFIRLLGLTNLLLVGWSLGGHISLELISRLNSLKGVLITGTPPIPVSIEGFNRGFHPSDPTIAACFGKGNLTLEESRLMAIGAGYDGSQEKHFLLEAVIATDEGAKTLYPLSMAKQVGQNQVEIVRNWRGPIAVIAGEKDPFVNRDYILEVPFQNLWRNKIFVIKDAGHPVQIEKAAHFNRLLHEFADEVFKDS